jgi:hypothetical protein
MAISIPVIGDWYRSVNGDLLEVVAFDESDATIEIQYFDGTVEEWDFDAWEEMELEAAEPPEDWSGSVDIAREDFTVDRDGSRPHDWSSHLDYLDSSE